ncbi:hypothetical protein [Selenomonas ruminantium]|uniref:Uncharacterized protein n=1 Tax=Selenomonas ruminantium TaxID=971 RepID=A0A1H3YFA7_SELRU|nr:hypothetical protein [Selenomonas ruminantium]SEA10279.1 hypothetical protein SAMN05660648_01946 [Selenomonas ruminantium]
MCRRSVYKICIFRKELAQFGWNFDRIYLQGADPFIRKTEDLLQIADMIYHYLPQVKSIGGHDRSEIGHSPLTYEQKAEDMLAVMKAVTLQWWRPSSISPRPVSALFLKPGIRRSLIIFL